MLRNILNSFSFEHFYILLVSRLTKCNEVLLIFSMTHIAPESRSLRYQLKTRESNTFFFSLLNNVIYIHSRVCYVFGIVILYRIEYITSITIICPPRISNPCPALLPRTLSSFHLTPSRQNHCFEPSSRARDGRVADGGRRGGGRGICRMCSPCTYRVPCSQTRLVDFWPYARPVRVIASSASAEK